MKAMKFRVESPEHSRQIQERLFEMGYKWKGEKECRVEKTKEPFLYAEANGCIMFDPIENHHEFEIDNATETTLQDIQWQPKQGEMIWVSNTGIEWSEREFLVLYNNEYICKHISDRSWWSYKHARPINTIQHEINKHQAIIDELKKKL